MSGLHSIPVTVVTAGHDDAPANVVLPVLHEIAAMLEALIASGRSASIDLRRAPLSAPDHDRLRAVLGQGEIEARLDCLGPVAVAETGISGVWWITYYSEDSRVVGEFIEVTTCPEILGTSAADIPAGLKRLRTRLEKHTQVADPDDLAAKAAALGFTPDDNLLHHLHPVAPAKRGNG